MYQTNELLTFDVVIAGAGPAGCTCALALKDAGLKVAILDKKSFPRNKVCGDAIPLRAIKTLSSIDPAFADSFKAFEKKLTTKSTAIIYNGQQVTFDWVRDAYTCTRMEFDNFLFSLVKNNTNTTIYAPISPVKYTQSADGIEITTIDGPDIKTKLLIGADGAHSLAAKQLAGNLLDRNHHAGSVRAYYSDIVGIENTLEIWFDKRFLPSYFWIFPLPGNTTNVGFGMLSEEIAKRKINLKSAFYQFIEQTPKLKSRFATATMISPLEGFGLPLGSNKLTRSGDHFMLVGDAASLIDPVTGEGIGNAMLSGKLAAEQAINSFKKNNFSSAFMKAYDGSLQAAIGKELRTHYKARKAISLMPQLLDLFFVACRSKLLKKAIQSKL